MRLFSRPLTAYFKIIGPTLGLVALGAIFYLKDRSLAWSSSDAFPFVVFLVYIWWALPIKRVWKEGDNFLIDNYLTQIRVPSSQLERVVVSHSNRIANVVLYFTQPTKFGKKIRIIVALGNNEPQLSSVGEVCDTMLANTSKRKASVPGT
jgi:hypothetical protein